MVEERELVCRAQKGDRPAFAALVERYWDGLYRWLYHVTRHRESAEDLAQEAFMKALAGLGSFRAGSNFKAWLYRIAYNSFLNQRRGKSPRPLLPEELPAPDEGPAEQVMTRENLLLLHRAVSKLPPDFRAAFLLRVEEGLSFREIGEILATTEETARWRVFKARQKLMEVLAPQLNREKP
jgi:RNA polymerase sigma-70 factor (ECF subfamily)